MPVAALVSFAFLLEGEDFCRLLFACFTLDESKQYGLPAVCRALLRACKLPKLDWQPYHHPAAVRRRLTLRYGHMLGLMPCMQMWYHAVLCAAKEKICRFTIDSTTSCPTSILGVHQIQVLNGPAWRAFMLKVASKQPFRREGAGPFRFRPGFPIFNVYKVMTCLGLYRVSNPAIQLDPPATMENLENDPLYWPVWQFYPTNRSYQLHLQQLRVASLKNRVVEEACAVGRDLQQFLARGAERRARRDAAIEAARAAAGMRGSLRPRQHRTGWIGFGRLSRD
jgi:hypothetical protein